MKKSQIFNEVPIKRPSRNLFDLSHEVKMSAKFSHLYPILVQECLPGDTFRDTSTILMRLAPMLAPIMHRVNVTTHFFFVPNRLTVGQELWEKFITGGREGDETPVLPYLTIAGITNTDVDIYVGKGTLWDYMGLPTFQASEYPAGTLTSTEQISVIPFLAYAKIWNDYYRDPNFLDEIPLNDNVEGNRSAGFVTSWSELRQRGWQKDYFTAALPFAQRGESVMLPLAATGQTQNWYQMNVGMVNSGNPVTIGDTKVVNAGLEQRIADVAGVNLGLGSIPVTVDESQVAMNDFRTALAIQSWLENNARGGGRYIEQIQVHFNVRVPDYRLQRAEYLGGGMQPVQISEVLSTAKTNVDGVTPVGDLSGHGISVGKSNRFTYRCQEHGYIIGVMSVMPTTAYQQGIDRMWSRRNKFDFAWPELAHLGEQEIYNKEVYYLPTAAEDADNNLTFGYIPRYSEYKFKQDRVSGDFRDNLAYWHLGRIFTIRPALGYLFTTANEDGIDENEEPMSRIFAVQDGTDYLWINIFHRLTAKRPLPYFGVPKLVG